MTDESKGPSDETLDDGANTLDQKQGNVFQHLGQHNVFPSDLIADRIIAVDDEMPNAFDYEDWPFEPESLMQEIEIRSSATRQEPITETAILETDEHDEPIATQPVLIGRRYTYSGTCKNCELSLLKLLCLDAVLKMPLKCWAIPPMKRTVECECTWSEDIYVFPREHGSTVEHIYPALFIFHFPNVTEQVYWVISKDAVFEDMKGHVNWLFWKFCPEDGAPFPEVLPDEQARVVPDLDDDLPRLEDPKPAKQKKKRPKLLNWDAIFEKMRSRVENQTKMEMELLTHRYDPGTVKHAEEHEEGPKTWALKRLRKKLRKALQDENGFISNLRQLGLKGYIIDFGQQWVHRQLERTLPRGEVEDCFKVEGENLSDEKDGIELPSMLFFVFDSSEDAVAIEMDNVDETLHEPIDRRFVREGKLPPYDTIPGPEADAAPEGEHELVLNLTGDFKGKRNLVLLGDTEILLSDAPFSLLLALAVARLRIRPGSVTFAQMSKMEICAKDRQPQAVTRLRGSLKECLEPKHIDPRAFIAWRQEKVSLNIDRTCIQIDEAKLQRNGCDAVHRVLSWKRRQSKRKPKKH